MKKTGRFLLHLIYAGAFFCSANSIALYHMGVKLWILILCMAWFMVINGNPAVFNEQLPKGRLRIYLTSTQLGIRFRVLGAVF